MSDTTAPVHEGPVALEARPSRNYLTRLVLMSILFVGFGCWALYDGAVKYPKQLEIYQRYQQLNEEGQLATEWPRLMREEGYPEQPKTRREFDIVTQYIMAAITLPVGLLYLTALLRYTGRTLRLSADGQTLGYGSKQIEVSSIKLLDTKLWPGKGIAIATTPQGKVVLDDWKFERLPTDRIIYRIQQQLPAERIFGGPIPNPDAPPAVSAQAEAPPSAPAE